MKTRQAMFLGMILFGILLGCRGNYQTEKGGENPMTASSSDVALGQLEFPKTFPLATENKFRLSELGYVNVRDYGASPANPDNTSQIQKAIDSGRKVIVPPGKYSISGTLNIGQSEYLYLTHGAWLKRLRSNTDNTEPVVRLHGNFAKFTGEGHGCGVMTENASGGRSGNDIINNGVVNVGPIKADKVANINFWVIDSIQVVGNHSAYKAYSKAPYENNVDKNELLTLVNSSKLLAKKGSCYNGRVSNCLFKVAGVAIKLNPGCNGNIFTNNHFYRITHSCYYSKSTSENLFTNCFVHSSPGVTVLRLKKTRYNHFYGVMCEPGPNSPNGRITRFCDISADSLLNVLIGHGNTGHSFINESPSSLIITHARIIHGRQAWFGGVATRSLEADQIISELKVDSGGEINEMFVKSFKPTKPTAFQDVFTFTCESRNQVFMIELSVVSGFPNTNTHSGAKYIISGKKSQGNITAKADYIGGNANIICDIQLNENKAIIRLKPSNPLHGKFIVSIRAKSTGKCSFNRFNSEQTKINH